MERNILRSALGGLVLLAMAPAARASVTIDFEDLAHNSDVATYEEVTSGGFRFHSSIAYDDSYGVYGRKDERNQQLGGATLSLRYPAQYGAGPFSYFEPASGGLFDLQSIDVGTTNGAFAYVQLIYFGASGINAIENFFLDQTPGLQTIAINRTNLSKVEFYVAYGYDELQIDNLVVGGAFEPPQPPVGGVPEPSTWALMILGFGAAGAMVRRRRVAVI